MLERLETVQDLVERLGRPGDNLFEKISEFLQSSTLFAERKREPEIDGDSEMRRFARESL